MDLVKPDQLIYTQTLNYPAQITIQPNVNWINL